MHCVSGSETWGKAGSSSREGIAVAHSGNRPGFRASVRKFSPFGTAGCYSVPKA